MYSNDNDDDDETLWEEDDENDDTDDGFRPTTVQVLKENKRML